MALRFLLVCLSLSYLPPLLCHLMTTPDCFADTGTEREVAERSILIKNMLEDIGDQAMTEAIPIPNVSFQHLVKPLRETS